MIEINKLKSNDMVEISESRVALEGNIIEINITHKDSSGARLYPNPFYIRKINIVKYPIDSSGKRAFIVPISDMLGSPTMNPKYVIYDLECLKCKEIMRQTIEKLTVSYVCNKCGSKSPIQWIVESATEIKYIQEKATVTNPKSSDSWGEWRSAATKPLQVEKKSAILPPIERKSQGEQSKFI
jgi:DNA-directed RNA polymerase subunit M/transcription elongation factor TFIIS